MKFTSSLQNRIFITRLYPLFKILQWIYTILDYLLEFLIGFSLVRGWKQNQIVSKKNGKTGNVTRILARGSSIFMGSLLLEDYVLIHEEYVDPEECILNNDNISLMAVSPTHAWFSIMPEDGATNRFPFFYINQFWFTEKILIVDHETLHQVAEFSKGPTKECILISNTGRCGSTLLNKVGIYYLARFFLNILSYLIIDEIADFWKVAQYTIHFRTMGTLSFAQNETPKANPERSLFGTFEKLCEVKVQTCEWSRNFKVCLYQIFATIIHF